MSLSLYNWYVIPADYAVTHTDDTLIYMHARIFFDVFNNERKEGFSIDHINRIKTDNRIANLRLATQSDQNNNRAARSDKQKPCQELVDAGVENLPRYVRWDKTEKKFVIEKHPSLVKSVEEGGRKTAMISGSKSSKLSVVEKYQDILAKLEVLETDTDFIQQRNKLEQEYHEICNPVRAYLGLPQVRLESKTCAVRPELKTTPGRRKIDSGLPKDCGVTIDMIPKHCYYKPATDKRGDMFVIERHPALVASGKRSVNTTSTKSKSTIEKFHEAMELYNTLESVRCSSN